MKFDAEVTTENLYQLKARLIQSFNGIMKKLYYGYSIQESSCSILIHIVMDLLDLAKIKAGKFS